MEQPAPSNSRPFMFDRSFDRGGMKAAAASERKPSTTFNEQELALAKEQAYEQGVKDGREAALAESQQKQTSLTGQVANLLERVAGDVWKIYAQQRQAATDIAAAIARKIVPDYVRKNGINEIAAAIEKTVAEMINEPRLVLRVHEQHFEFLSKEVEATASRLGYSGKIIVLADPNIGENDCRLEWADGGMERNVNMSWTEIDRQLAKHYASPQSPPLPASEPPPSTSVTA